MTVKEISQRAKKIRAQYPNKKWTDCIKQASKELKSGKVGATKKVSGTKTVNLKKGDKVFILPKGTTETITKVNKDGRYETDKSDYTWRIEELRKVIKPKKVGATKSVPANQTRRNRTPKKPVSKHKDLMSHNVRINVLSGMCGAERPVTLNGLKNLTKGAWYIYNDKTNTVFKYIGKDTKGGGYPLIFDTYTKKSSGSYIFTGRWEYSLELMKYLHRVKKPTAKELSIGHLKLIK